MKIVRKIRYYNLHPSDRLQRFAELREQTECYGDFKEAVFIRDAEGDYLLLTNIPESLLPLAERTSDDRYAVRISELDPILAEAADSLKELLRQLETRKSNPTEDLPQHYPRNVLGFSLYRDKRHYFYGSKRHKGRKHCVFIGRNPFRAKDKISAYCAKRRINF